LSKSRAGPIEFGSRAKVCRGILGIGALSRVSEAVKTPKNENDIETRHADSSRWKSAGAAMFHHYGSARRSRLLDRRRSRRRERGVERPA
jgi:hypothetical protein